MIDSSAFASIPVGSTLGKVHDLLHKSDKAARMVKEIAKKNEGHAHSDAIVGQLDAEIINFAEGCDVDLIMICMLGKTGLEQSLWECGKKDHKNATGFGDCHEEIDNVNKSRRHNDKRHCMCNRSRVKR